MNSSPPDSAAPQGTAAGVVPRSHLRPRTRRGWVALLLFLGLLLLAEPPMVFVVANRIEPWILGLPFFYAYLLADYVAMIGVLIWAMRRRV